MQGTAPSPRYLMEATTCRRWMMRTPQRHTNPSGMPRVSSSTSGHPRCASPATCAHPSIAAVRTVATGAQPHEQTTGRHMMNLRSTQTKLEPQLMELTAPLAVMEVAAMRALMKQAVVVGQGTQYHAPRA